MARVVQRRISPPYLLVSFVILFLLATAAAVLLWVQLDQLANRHRQLEDNFRRATSVQELSNPTPSIREMLAEYDRNPKRVTVLSQQAARIAELSEIVAGRESSYATARAHANQLAQDIGTTLDHGLVAEARDLHAELTRNRAEVETLRRRTPNWKRRSAKKTKAQRN